MNNMSFDTEDITSSERILHTPSEFARKNLLYIQEVGKLRSIKPHVSGRSELESYLLFIVLKGSGKVTTAGKEYHVKDGDVIFIDCMKPYEHISDANNPWELAWVHLYGNGVAGYYDLFLQKNHGENTCSVKSVKDYMSYIDKIMENQDEKDIMSEINSSLYLTGILTQIIKDASDTSKNEKEHSIIKLRELVNERFKEENLFEKLCNEFGYDEIAINSDYKSRYGIDLCDYILNRRFTYAKELIRFTVKPVKDIVKESGIGNADLFRHLFIENEGMTAEEYRRKWSQWNRG